jgi:hypothetical protein
MANEFIARKGLVVLESGVRVTGSSNFVGDVTASGNIRAANFYGSAQLTGSFTGSFVGDGSQLGGLATTLAFSGSSGNDSINLKTEALTIDGSNGITTTVTNNTVTVNAPSGTVTASVQIDHNATTNYTASRHVDHTAVNITAGSGLSGGGDISATRTLTLDTGSTHFISGSFNANNLKGLFSSSQQTDVRNTTGIATIATTGSNTFTGVQTISDTTNSTVFNNGALIVAGGVGIAKDVNISGSLRVVGLLTAASMSTQYVTSSQVNVGVSRILLNDDDNIRFAGISIFDSGSSTATASIFWDSQNHHFIYQNEGIDSYTGGMFIAGPRNTGALGDEVGLTANRVPVAMGGDHIDSRLESSSIRVDFPSRLTHIEAGLYVTGAITSSVGFAGDGSNLTGVVSTLSVTGSQGGQGSVNLKTQGLTVTGTNGLVATVSGETLTVSGSNATTSAKGVASFNSTNFTVTAGEVTSNNITINGGTVTLGGTRNITLAQITTQGATTTDQVTFNGGAIIHGVLFTSASATSVAGPVTNQVIATVATGSYDSAQFDYVLKDGTNYRTGTVMAVWNSTTGIEFTDTSTADIGNTGQAVLSVDTSAANVRLKLTLTSGTWTAKTAIRML